MDEPSFEMVEDAIWQSLVRGKADRKSAFHTPTVASVGADGIPHQRIMVLRAVDRASATLRFHTDIRSGKVADFARGGHVSVLVYDTKAKVQIRVGGTAVIEQDGPTATIAWGNTSPSSRRTYLVNPGPGTKVDHPVSGLTQKWEGVAPSAEDSEAGRAAFAVMIIKLHRMEWLTLAATGHRRALFELADSKWSGQWLVP